MNIPKEENDDNVNLDLTEEAAAARSVQAQLQEASVLSTHTILLIQFAENEESRTYIDCRTPEMAFESFLRMYETFEM